MWPPRDLQPGPWGLGEGSGPSLGVRTGRQVTLPVQERRCSGRLLISTPAAQPRCPQRLLGELHPTNACTHGSCLVDLCISPLFRVVTSAPWGQGGGGGCERSWSKSAQPGAAGPAVAAAHGHGGWCAAHVCVRTAGRGSDSADPSLKLSSSTPSGVTLGSHL